MTRAALLGAAAAALLACAPLALVHPSCSEVAVRLKLPAALRETSGAAFGRIDSSVVWTHNDDGGTLFALDLDGSVRGSIRVRHRLADWEDIAAGECASGSCLYLADTGDNAERRPAGHVRILRIPEPTLPLGREALEPDVFPLRLPDGPRDVEALFVLPGERLHLVTKGRNHAVTVYRYPGPLRPDTVTLEEVQRFGDGPRQLADQVTGADASVDGGLVALRTYQTLSFHRVAEDGRIEAAASTAVNLRVLRESQGEAVGLGPDGLVALTSEGGLFGAAPSMNVLRCLP